MINGMLVYAKELVSRAREAGRSVPLITIKDWTVGDEVGMGVAIQTLNK